MQSHRKFNVLLLTVLTVAVSAAQESKRSPDARADVTLGGKTVTITYNRPSMRGRKIMGDLVPYGSVWRTGANEATTLTTAATLNIGGVNVPAGKYTLYSVPGEKSWKLIINKQTGQWGTEYDQEQDLARVNMKVSPTSAPVEQFLILWDKKNESQAELVMEWENTRVSVPVKVVAAS